MHGLFFFCNQPGCKRRTPANCVVRSSVAIRRIAKEEQRQNAWCVLLLQSAGLQKKNTCKMHGVFFCCNPPDCKRRTPAKCMVCSSFAIRRIAKEEQRQNAWCALLLQSAGLRKKNLYNAWCALLLQTAGLQK